MSRTTISDEATAVAGLASAVHRHAQAYGIDILPICRAMDIDPQVFQSLTGRISIDRLCRLLETCALLSNDEAFGLKNAQVFVPGSTGAYGYGLLAAPTVSDFVQFLADHMQYVTETSYCTLDRDASGATLAWTFSPLIVRRDQYVDMTVGLVCQRLRDMTGDHIAGIEIELERARPRQPAIFRELMSRRLSFGCQINLMRIPAAVLCLQNPKGDPKLFQLMDIQCRSLRTDCAAGLAFADQVRRHVRLHIAEADLSLETIAPYFGMSERTFQRRLADDGMTLNELRDAERRDVSFRLLTTSDLAISDICYRLGYSAPSAFTRSVIRWFGASPRALRRQTAV